MENFNLDLIKNLSPNDAKTYITKYFVPLSDGNHAFLEDNKYIVQEASIIKATYFNRISKDLNKYYFNEYTGIKKITYALNKPVFFDNYLNLCPKMKWDYNPNYKPDSKTQKALDFFINDYLLEVLCSSNQESLTFLNKWLSNMTKGNKNNSCLYLKGIQGIGKTTIFEFLCNHVVGKPLCLETGSDPIRTKFNEILGGKLLVGIEELENFGKSEWESMSSTLKRMITSSRINLQNKGTKSYEADNINNYILCSNNDAIKDDEGRRYFILDISTHRYEDEEYFNKLYRECFNDKVGEAFFQYLYNIDTTNFNPQKYPLTKNKLDSYAKRLDSVYQFLKNSYIASKRNIYASVQDLYEEYKCNIDTTKKPYNLQDFNKKLSEVNIIYYKSNNTNKYKVSYETLLSIANKRHWIHDLDEFDEEATKEEETIPKSQYDDLLKQMEELKAQMEELKQQKDIKPIKEKKARKPIKKTSIAEDDFENALDDITEDILKII